MTPKWVYDFEGIFQTGLRVSHVAYLLLHLIYQKQDKKGMFTIRIITTY